MAGRLPRIMYTDFDPKLLSKNLEIGTIKIKESSLRLRLNNNIRMDLLNVPATRFLKWLVLTSMTNKCLNCTGTGP